MKQKDIYRNYSYTVIFNSCVLYLYFSESKMAGVGSNPGGGNQLSDLEQLQLRFILKCAVKTREGEDIGLFNTWISPQNFIIMFSYLLA